FDSRRLRSLVFFFQCCCPAPDLLSFPTRRSSDLSMFDEGVVAAVPVDIDIDTSPGTPGAYEIESIRVGRITQWYPEHVRVMVYKDRKSTRLNSSHVSISYAVFCLKKKNTKIYTPT